MSFGAQTRRLLAEAMEWHRGVDGLAELARTPGPHRANGYQDWMDGLVRAGRTGEAEQAAQEALRELDPHGEPRARIADRLALLVLARNDGAALLEARRTAWQASPTLLRLLRLVGAATALDRRAEVLAAEAERAATGPLARRPALAASLLLLAGRVDEAVGLAARADQDCWNDSRHPAEVFVPFLLVGGSDAGSDPRWSTLLLHDLLTQVDSIDWLDTRNDDLERFRAALDPALDPGDGLRLSTLFLAAISEQQPDPEQRRQWLDQGLVHIDSQVAAVIGATRRRSYSRVAELAVASAEALALTSGVAAGRASLDRLRSRYPRHAAFHRELRSAADNSPLL